MRADPVHALERPGPERRRSAPRARVSGAHGASRAAADTRLRFCLSTVTVPSRARRRPTSERPSARHGNGSPSTRATVGTTSMFRATPSSIRPVRWPGSFTKSGTNAISSRFSGVGRRLWSREADAVVRGHDHERTVVDAGLAESAEDDPERAVRVAGLEEVALVPLHRRPRLEPVPVVEPAEESRVHRVAPPGGEIDVRDVGEQRVREVQRRPRVVVDQLGEPAGVPPAGLDLARRAPLHGLLGLRHRGRSCPTRRRSAAAGRRTARAGRGGGRRCRRPWRRTVPCSGPPVPLLRVSRRRSTAGRCASASRSSACGSSGRAA